MSAAAIIVGFVFSTIGIGLFVYGKRQQRVPQLVTGLILMVCPFLVPGAAWTACVSVALLVGLWFAVRAGW